MGQLSGCIQHNEASLVEVMFFFPLIDASKSLGGRLAGFPPRRLISSPLSPLSPRTYI